MPGSDRKAAVESALAAIGGTLERLAFTRGEYDVVVTATVPDSSSLIGLVVAIKATGAFEKADYLEEVDISPALDAANTAQGADAAYHLLMLHIGALQMAPARTRLESSATM